jgi:hypothetical protein
MSRLLVSLFLALTIVLGIPRTVAAGEPRLWAPDARLDPSRVAAQTVDCLGRPSRPLDERHSCLSQRPVGSANLFPSTHKG